jgi:hypothetical protein
MNQMMSKKGKMKSNINKHTNNKEHAYTTFFVKFLFACYKTIGI